MPETCFMKIICLHKHAPRFEAMCFGHATFPPEHPIRAELVIGAAKYRQVYELPQDVPYIGFHGEFDLESPHFIACDGQRFVKVPCDGYAYLLNWNEETNEPDAEDMVKVREYFVVKKAAEALMQGLL